MYAEVTKIKKELPILYQCQDCEQTFGAKDSAQQCPHCFSKDRSNLIVLHMEEDQDRAEWLALVEFSAGD